MEFDISKIKRVTLKQTVYPFCPLGNDFFRADITITGKKQKRFLDFTDATAFMRSLSGKQLTVEQVAEKCKEYFTEYYVENEVEVSAASDAHCPVTVQI